VANWTLIDTSRYVPLAVTTAQSAIATTRSVTLLRKNFGSAAIVTLNQNRGAVLLTAPRAGIPAGTRKSGQRGRAQDLV
jgi:hypothetical protein